MEEIIEEYVRFCRTIGPWTDWIQGPGGNFSIKTDSHILVKRSGAVIADTNRTKGWVLCKRGSVEECLENSNETLPAGAIEQGDGKASIEVFLHALPARMIMHAHPTFLLQKLADPTVQDFHLPIPFCIIPYRKPGIPLAQLLFENYEPTTHIYFLKNHGVLVTGNTLDDIIQKMIHISNCVQHIRHQMTNIPLIYPITQALNKLVKPLLFLKNPYFNERLFMPYTPDIAVFLQDMPLSFESGTSSPLQKLEKYREESKYQTPTVIYTHDMIYVIGDTMEKCTAIQEILYSYFCIHSETSLPLSDTDVKEIVTWDKELERKK